MEEREKERKGLRKRKWGQGEKDRNIQKNRERKREM
jgi:hypothetical protein